MRRKSLWLSIGLLLLMAFGVLATLTVLVRHEPSFYSRSAIAAGPQRKDWSDQFKAAFLTFTTSIRNGGHPQTGNWYGKFTEAEINSFLSEEFVTSNLAEKLLPEDVSEPRFLLEQDRMRLGFRYGSGFWSTVISVEFRVWLAQREPNVVVLELQSLHAGALPISAQSLLEEISEALRRQNIQVTWYRHRGNPTAALKFNTDQPRPSCQVQQVDLKPGTLCIFGHSSEPLPGADTGRADAARPGNP